MNEELRTLLTTVAVGTLIGTAVGVTIRWAQPNWARGWKKFVLNRQWKLFAFGTLLFGTAAILQWHEGRLYYATASLAMCILEIAALFRYGFKSLSPEMEQQIDQQ